MKKIIIKGKTTVSDIGSGTGFLSFLARQIGAKECFAYESDPSQIELSRKLAKANGMTGCHFIEGHSAQIRNPVKTDLVISETLGNFALEENIIETMNDARRFLKSGGKVMPENLSQFAAPVTSARIYNEINIWDRIGFGLDFTAAKEAAMNNMYVYKIAPKELLQNGEGDAVQKWDFVDFKKKNDSIRNGATQWRLEKTETVYGWAIWWECELAPGITFSTSPFSSPTHWNQIFLPLVDPIKAVKGDILRVRFFSDSRYEIGIRVKWTAELERNGKVVKKAVMDTSQFC